jgi:hypothetical protein
MTHPENSFNGNDPRLIDIDNPAERAYWVKSLAVTEAQLRALVDRVGRSAQRVKDALRAQR